MVARRVIVLVLGLGWPVLAGSFHFGEIRYFPNRYTAPEVETQKDGKKTYKPAVPTDFKEYHLGIGGESSRVGVRQAAGAVAARPSVRIRLKESGQVIQVRQGDVFDAGGRRYRILGIWDDAVKYQDLKSGVVRRKKR